MRFNQETFNVDCIFVVGLDAAECCLFLLHIVYDEKYTHKDVLTHKPNSILPIRAQNTSTGPSF